MFAESNVSMYIHELQNIADKELNLAFAFHLSINNTSKTRILEMTTKQMNGHKQFRSRVKLPVHAKVSMPRYVSWIICFGQIYVLLLISPSTCAVSVFEHELMLPPLSIADTVINNSNPQSPSAYLLLALTSRLTVFAPPVLLPYRPIFSLLPSFLCPCERRPAVRTGLSPFPFHSPAPPSPSLSLTGMSSIQLSDVVLERHGLWHLLVIFFLQ